MEENVKLCVLPLLAALALVLGTVPVFGATIYPSTDTPLVLADLSTTTSTLNVPDSFLISDVNVTLNITHTFDGDLNISLASPLGTSVDLSTNNGGSGNNYTDTVFDDSAGTALTSGSAPVAGTFRPEQLISAFNGENAFGDWILTVKDEFGGDSGDLNSWSLELAGAQVPEPSTFVLLSLGLGLVGFRRWSQRRAHSNL